MRNIVPFTTAGAILYAPGVAYVVFVAVVRPARASSPNFVGGVFLLLAGSCLWFVAPLAVVHGVLQQLRGQRASLLGCLRVLLSRLLPALGVGVVVAIAALSTMATGSLVASMLGSLGLPSPVAIILVSAGVLYVYCIFWVAIPVVVVERPGVFASLGRSGDLTRGSRTAIFVVSLVALAVQVVPLVLAGMALRGLRGPLVAMLFLVLAIVFGAYTAVAITVAYHDLRVAKEGAGARNVARVFA